MKTLPKSSTFFLKCSRLSTLELYQDMAGKGEPIHACSVCDRLCSVSTCALCTSIISGKKNRSWSHHIREEIHDRARTMLGEVGRTAQQRWKHILHHTTHSEEVTWAHLPQHTDPVVSQPGSSEELNQIIQSLSDGVRLTAQQRNMLLDGFTLHDGSRVSFSSSKLMVNGRTMPFEVPVVSFLTLLTSPKKRIGWDLSKLFSIFGTLNLNYQRKAMNDRQRFGRPPRLHPLQKPGADALFNWIQWMAEEHLIPPKHYTLTPIGAWARDIKNRLSSGRGRNKFDSYIVDAFKHHPSSLRALSEYPWMNRWVSYVGTTQDATDRPWPFAIEGMKLKLKVRSVNNAARKTPVPVEPGVWAFLLSSILSPITSDEGELLYALQYNWTAQTTQLHEVPAPLRRSIQFLNEVIDGNSNQVHIHNNRLLVVGKLGHFYEVRVGKGVHSAPFIIEAIRSLEPRRTYPLCIHSGTFHATVPLGDTIAAVVLSLVDDINVATSIDSLALELHSTSPLGFPRTLEDAHIPLLDSTNLAAFVQHAVRRRQSITWLPPEMRRATNAQARRQGNFAPLFNRQHEFNAHHRHDLERSLLARTNTLVQHAIAANRPPPLPQFIEMWHTSLSSDEGGSSGTGHDDHLYHRIHGRNEWMFLRNFAEAETVHPIGDAREGERRYCELFPLLWEAMMLHPVGSTLRISQQNNGVINFQHCNLSLTVRNPQERRIMCRFATLLGYREREPAQGMMILERRGGPRNNARRDLTLLLNRSQGNLGVRGAPPWWWHYRDVCQAPAQAPEFRWELEQEYRDDIRR